MKKVQLVLGITAFAFGAFAFTPASVKSGQASAEYYINEAGQPQGLVDENHPCLNESTSKCSATFTVVNGQPTGTATNIQMGPRQL